MNRFFLTAIAFLFSMSNAAFAAPASDALPTVEELKAQLGTDPKSVNLTVSRLLAVKGAAAANYDRYELLMLRGEASLRMKTLPAATEAFAQAQKETTDASKQGIARANEVLIRKSKQNGYTPSPAGRLKPGTKPPEAMPIIEDADRKAAMSVFVDDQLAALQPKITASRNAALPAIIELASALGDVRVVEQYVTEKPEKTEQPMKEISGQAHKLIKKATSSMSTVLDEAHANATNRETWRDNAGGKHQQEYLGMNSVYQGKVRDVIETATKVHAVAQQLATATGNDKELAADATDAKGLAERGQELLRRYGPKTK